LIEHLNLTKDKKSAVYPIRRQTISYTNDKLWEKPYCAWTTMLENPV